MQIFPNTESVIRLVGALLVEVNDEMISADKRYIAAASLEPLTTRPRTIGNITTSSTPNLNNRIARPTPPAGTQSGRPEGSTQ